jgi:hypothetical protein
VNRHIACQFTPAFPHARGVRAPMNIPATVWSSRPGNGNTLRPAFFMRYCRRRKWRVREDNEKSDGWTLRRASASQRWDGRGSVPRRDRR